MTTSPFIQNLPKAELHVHLEGTIEPDFLFDCAKRNGVDLPYKTCEEVLGAYDFHDLPSFLAIYYRAMEVLQCEQDFYEMAMRYFTVAAEQNIIYVEPFFDPQAHTSRGIAFDTIVHGIHKAQVEAEQKWGLHSNLIMCFLRDMSADSAQEHLAVAAPFVKRQWIVGVGLDSDEKDNPPSKFQHVFRNARNMGLKLTMHCDVNQENIVAHLWECLDLIQVDRIDHGINTLDDPKLVATIRERKLGLTVCPISNRFVVQTLTGNEIRKLLQEGILATVNSDDPAYFRGYMNENLQALSDDANYSPEELAQLTRNAFAVSWAAPELKSKLQGRLEAFLKDAVTSSA